MIRIFANGAISYLIAKNGNEKRAVYKLNFRDFRVIILPNESTPILNAVLATIILF